MVRRVFYISFGAAAGVLVVRWVANAAEALTPGSLAGNLTAALEAFLDDVRAAMAEREIELRGALGLDGRHDELADEQDELSGELQANGEAEATGAGAGSAPAGRR